MVKPIRYSSLAKEAQDYWEWHQSHPILPMDSAVAKEGAGSELRSPLFHYGTVLPIYLSVIRYLDKLPTTAGLRLVELGSGTGRLLAYMQSRFPYLSITGTDYSRECIAYAQRAYGQYGISFIHDSAQRTTLKPNSMDIVISSHVIEHIPLSEGAAFLKESRRLLKKGGIVFVGTPERRRSQDLYQKNPHDTPKYRLVPPHEHEYTYTELKALAQTIYGSSHVRVDKIYNPVFHKIFAQSIAKFKPRPGVLGFLASYLYRVLRDGLPKPVFDVLTKVGASITMRAHGLTYRTILVGNRIETGKTKNFSDNLLLVAQK
jgi:predicted SAM-dependent methyltransferase